MWALPYLCIQPLLHSRTWLQPQGDDCLQEFNCHSPSSLKHGLCLQQYHATIRYRPVRKVPLHDALFRLSSIRQRDEIPLDLPGVAHIFRLTHNGWPATCWQASRISQNHCSMRDELTSDNSLLIKVYRIIIQPALIESLLHNLHNEHADITECQLPAWALICWPHICRHIDDYISQCHKCIKLLQTYLFKLQ